jgi:DNA-binding IclR family transcriptional regulator
MSREAMESEVHLTRERGYSTSRLEYTPGVLTFAAPVFDIFGRLSRILMCFGVAEEMLPRETLIVDALLRSAWNINRLFSSQGPSSD